jgi:nitrogen fixation/metabolism regulation signal transduction histidine kinase
LGDSKLLKSTLAAIAVVVALGGMTALLAASGYKTFATIVFAVCWIFALVFVLLRWFAVGKQFWSFVRGRRNKRIDSGSGTNRE